MPEERLSAEDALKHEYFTKSLPPTIYSIQKGINLKLIKFLKFKQLIQTKSFSYRRINI